MSGPSGAPSGVMREALLAFRRGDLRAARAAAEVAARRQPRDLAIRDFLGAVCAHAGDLPSAVGHWRAALAGDPGNGGARANLATALVEQGDLPGAAALCTPDAVRADRGGRLLRLRAWARLATGELVAAVGDYRLIVGGAPDDFESWNNLGNALADLGQPGAAADALARATALRPDLIEVQLNYAAVLGRAGREADAIVLLEGIGRLFPADPRPFTELGSWLALTDREAEAVVPLRRAAALAPDDPDTLVRLALVEIPAGNIGAAREALTRAIALRPDHEDANLKLAILFETNNMTDALEAIVGEARARGVKSGAVAFIEALSLRRRKLLEEALAAAERVDPDVEPVRTAQMQGELFDRLDDADRAWAAFAEMNRQAVIADQGDPAERAERYAAEVRATRDLLTPTWIAGWRPIAVAAERPSPVFLVGSPRSGTTLLDTLLMGHPRVRVLEEQPPLRLTARQLGGNERLPDLDDAEVQALRDRYFAEVDALVPFEPGALVVDKFPLHMNRVPLIHRLFPQARILFAERHPLDVVLSTFITNFRLNYAMANYLDLERAARMYDLSMDCWTRATELLPVAVHRVRYERIVADREAELRPALAFLGLDWDEGTLDNQGIALGRGNIKTASYSQVTEQVYQRARGRWVRYRRHLAPVMPLIAPWAERMGYEL